MFLPALAWGSSCQKWADSMNNACPPAHEVATEHLHSSLNANCIYELSGAGSSRSSGTSRRATGTMAAFRPVRFLRPFDEEE